MSVVSTNLGTITAYGEAVNGGYTGTKAEFQTAMNNYAQGITNASEALTKANANLANTAETYSASATYAVGDYVIYENQLYKCTTAITTAESWTFGHWTAVNIADDVSTLNADITAISSNDLTDDVKTALLQIAQKVVYIDANGQTYYDALYDALYPPASVTGISASYSGGTVRVGASLDSLRNDLTVIASYEDSTTETVTGYTLSGTLTEGTQTVTVSYGGKTTTFEVTVVSSATLLNSWDFTESMVDSVGGKTATTTATQDATGLHFTSGQKYAEFPTVYAKDRTYEIDVTSILRSGTNLRNNYGRLFMIDADNVTGTGGSGYLLTAAKKGGDLFYMNGAWESSIIVSNATDADGSYYDGSTVGFYIDSSGYVHVYKNGTLLGVSTGALAASYDGSNVYFGSSSNQDGLYNATFTGFRVYDGNKYGGA